MQCDIQEYELTDVQVIRGRFLKHKKSDLPATLHPHISYPISIPFGSVSRKYVADYRFVLQTQGTNLYRLLAFPRNESYDDTKIIWPPYRRTVSIYHDKLGEILIEIWQMHIDIHRIQAMQIILRSHYLNAPNRGVFLGCRFTEEHVLHQARELARREMEENGEIPQHWSDAWFYSANNMVGCAVLDTLMHGNPAGRREIAQREYKIAVYESGNRKEIVDALRVGWASRFAIDEPYRGLGIGQLLAQHIAHVGFHHRIPPAHYVEVITTQKVQDNGIHHDDFLVEAGYTRVSGNRRQPSQLSVDPETGTKVDRQRVVRLYYYFNQLSVEKERETSVTDDTQKRLFVPLNAGPYEWFKSGQKRWELRKQERQYKDTNVAVGQRVELRRGYSDKTQALWGTVADVKLATTISDFFAQVPFTEVIPTAQTQEEAIEQAQKILKMDSVHPVPVIGFKVELDHG